MNRRNVLQAAGALAVASVIPDAFGKEPEGHFTYGERLYPDGPFEFSQYVPNAQPYKTLGICPYDIILPVSHEDINPVHEEIQIPPTASGATVAIRVLSTLDDKFRAHVESAREQGERDGYELDTTRDVLVSHCARKSAIWAYHADSGEPGDYMWIRNQVHLFNARQMFDRSSKYCPLYMSLVHRRAREYDRRHPVTLKGSEVTVDDAGNEWNVFYNINSDEYAAIDNDLSYLRIRFFLKRKGLDEDVASKETAKVYSDDQILAMGIAPWTNQWGIPNGWGA